MTKKMDQSRKAKSKFSSILLEYNLLNSKEYTDKQEIADKLNISERKVRREISKISMYYPVISKSNKKGYKLAKPIDLMGKEELIEEIKEVDNVANELQSRIRQLKAKLKPLIAYKSVAEKKLLSYDNIKIEIYRKEN